MERDVSLLRCSKLSCYSEFNRMVQAIARNGGEGDITTIPGARPQTGTSAEYNFYTTLVLMLKQVIRNRDSLTQKRELQRVYEWFCLNKPLIRSKTKPTQRKPKLSITTTPDKIASAVPFPFLELDRPQTAPASLYQPHRSSGEDARVPRGTARERPSPSKRRPTFTAMYISRSLNKGMDLIGQPLDQLQLKQKQWTVASKSQERISLSREKVVAVDDNVAVTKSKAVNVIDFPSSDFPTHGRPDTAESAVSLATVFSMAPGVAAQMILERELNEHCESNRKKALSFHTTQSLRIGSDYRPTDHRLVNTPTDSAAMEPFLMKRYSAADSLGTSERVNQKSVDHSLQASPRHQQRAIEEPKRPRPAIRSVGNNDEANTTDQSPNSVENRIQATALSSEAQEMMLDMKAVDSRTSALSLSQISLKQKESPRTKHKQNSSHDIDTVSRLQIEGQGVKQRSPEAAKVSPRFTSSTAAAATHREQRINSPRSSTKIAHEAKSSGSLASLLIRPVSLQHHSSRTGATSSVNQEGERVYRNSNEKPGDTEDTGESKDIAAPGDSNSDANHVTADSEETAPLPEGSLTRPGEKADLPTGSEDEGAATSQDKLTESESQNITEENSTSATDCINEGREDRATSPQKEEIEDLEATSGASGLTKQLTETGSSISQDQPSISHDGEMPKSPVVMVKTTPSPARPHSSRPTSSSHKSRFLSPVNVVSLSFPSDKLAIGNRQQTIRQTTAAEAGRKTPTIIAGFNRKRYRRLKSSPAAYSK